MLSRLVVLLILLVWLVVIWFLRRYRVWILFYIIGTTGLAYLLTQIFSYSFDIRTILAQSVAVSVHYLLGLVQIETQIVSNAPGVLLVLVLTQRVGWTILQIGVESSGLLEMIVLTSLVIFYPGWSTKRRLASSLAGICLSWGANIFRMIVIAVMLHFFGKEALVLAHTFIGKLVFFGLTLAIYWAIITFPSLGIIERKTTARQAAGL
jgi:exosortase family protein XrtG